MTLPPSRGTLRHPISPFSEKRGVILANQKGIDQMANYIAVCFLIALPLAAQDARKVEEPEYVNSAFRLDANAALTALERQPAHPVTKPQGLGHVASKVLVFPGDRSPVRF